MEPTGASAEQILFRSSNVKRQSNLLFPSPLAGVGLARLFAGTELCLLPIPGMMMWSQTSATLANFELTRRTKVDARTALLDLAIGQVEGAGARWADDAAVALPLLLGGAATLPDANAGTRGAL